MTITIADGRGALWQWDTGRRLRVGSGVEQIHYQNRALGGSVDVAVGTDGTAVIPDELLQDCHTLTAYAYVTDDTGAYTMEQQDFIVHKRAKPAGYVYTPTDQMTLQMIQRQIGDLADLTTEAKDTLVAAINEAARTGGGAGSMDLRVADGYVQYSTDGGMTWTNLIAMAELKGADGITPHIGDNGNWYLGTEDTGKPSRGETGPQGTPGIYYGTTQPTGDTHPVWIDPDGGPDDGGLLPAVTAADNGKVLRVVNSAWSAADMPEALPNPNALTFTGAVTGSYDGSAPLSVEIPSGGGSGSDISLGLTGAAVGQIAKITAVDDTGKPTAWEAVDIPSGWGGGGNWKQAGFVQSETDGEILEVSGLDTKSIRLVVCAAAYANDTNPKGATIMINGAISLNYAGFIQLTDINVTVIEIHLITTPSGNYIFAPNFPLMRVNDTTATNASYQIGNYSSWFLVRADTVEKIESISFACTNGKLLTGSKLNVEVI